MSFMLDYTSVILLYKLWIIVGISLIIIDILFLNVFFLLSIGFSSFIIAFLLYGQEELWSIDLNPNFIILSDWQDVLITFSVLSILSIGLIKYFFQTRSKKLRKDINDY